MNSWTLYFVVPRLHRHGGYERQALALAAALRQCGAPPRILTDAAPGDAPCRQLTAATPLGLYRQFATEFAAARRAGPVVVHVHALYRFSALAIVAAQRQNLPVLLKLPSSTDVEMLFESRRLALRLFRPFLHRVNRLVCPSREAAAQAGRHGAAICIPNGVETIRFAPGPNHLRRGLLFVGRHVALKGGEVLLRAFAVCRSQLPNETDLTMVGDGPARPAWENLARELGLTGHAKFVGEQMQPADFYRAAQAFVLPSLREGLPNTLLEAMACGLSCLASDTGGMRDVLADRFPQQLFPPGDSVALAQNLPALLRSDLGPTMREHVEANYSIGAVAQRYLDLYAELTR